MSDKIDKAFDDLMSAEHMTGGASQVLAEHMNDLQDEIERLTAEIGRARSALHESYRTFGYSHEQSALMVSQALSAGEGREVCPDCDGTLQPHERGCPNRSVESGRHHCATHGWYADRPCIHCAENRQKNE